MATIARRVVGTPAKPGTIGTHAMMPACRVSSARLGGSMPRSSPGPVNAGVSAQEQEETESRSMVSSTLQYSSTRDKKRVSGNPVSDFMSKVHLAWRIFFPEKQKSSSPKEEVKRRLKMVLVADRCGMSPASLSEMKKTIARALQDFVDIEAEDAIEVSITVEPTLGTVYSVNIPVRRVKPETRFGNLGLEGQVADGITLEWDPTDWNSDPSSRFPMGC